MSSPLRIVMTALTLGLILLLPAVPEAGGPIGSVSVASIQYEYAPPWGLFQIASSAKALSGTGSVVAAARVTSPMPSGPISTLEVEEVIYRDGTSEVVARGMIQFDVRGRVISYRSTSGMPRPIFDRWQMGGPGSLR